MLEMYNTYTLPWLAQPTTMSEGLNTYIQTWAAQPATMSERLNTYIQPWEAQPSTMSERLSDSSLPLGRNLDLNKTKLLSEVIKLHSSHF